MNKQLRPLRDKFRGTRKRIAAVLADTRGELATNTIGGIIVAVVIIGLLIVAIDSFFPGFFSDMFSRMADKLNANW